MKALSVDDNAENRYLMEAMLGSAGYEVESAVNGLEALEKLESKRFDVIISDILMPQMDGFQFCREVKSRPELRDIPFVFYTATYTEAKDEEFGLKLGAARFIIKPQEPVEFITIIQQVVSETYTPTPGQLPPPEEQVYLRTYNQRLIEKLQRKVEQLEASSSQLHKALEEKQKEIAERQRLEDMVRQSQKMECFGMLASGVAHDFNNMLSAILMNAELLQDYPGLEARGRDSLKQIAEAAHRAANLTRQLLTFSRKQPMERRRIDLNEVLENLAKMLHRVIGEEITLHSQGSPDPLELSGDAGMLEQVIVNLVINARDAMQQGGDLSIRASRIHITAEHVVHNPAAREGEFICLGVQDTGCGIEPGILPLIFEPFFTTKETGKGTGLGLSMVYSLVEKHEGWVEVESTPGQGSLFQVYLPVSGPVEERQAVNEPQPHVETGQEGILVVEDESAVRLLMGDFLRDLGYQVIEARDSKEALGLWDQIQDRVDLLLTDLVLPGGITGQELAGRLQELRPQLKVLFTSGYNTGPQLSSAWEEGLDFLPKPFTPAVLAQTVRRRLAS